MDLKKLKLGVEPVKESTATAVTVTFDKFQNGNGKALEMTLLPFSSPEGQREIRRWQMKFGIGKKPAENLDASDDELDALAEKDADSNIELMARTIAAWNLEDGAKGPVECSLVNRKALLDTFPAVVEALSDMLKKIAADLGNSKAA